MTDIQSSKLHPLRHAMEGQMAYLGHIPDDDPIHPLRKPRVVFGSGMRPLRRTKTEPKPNSEPSQADIARNLLTRLACMHNCAQIGGRH